MTDTSPTPPPPVEPGNVRALTHGARSRSDRLVLAEAGELEAFLFAEHPHLVDADQLAARLQRPSAARP
jgi:hypothetical protein